MLPPDPLPAEVLSAIQRGKAIEAIKLLREATGMDWKEARDVVNRKLRNQPASATKPASLVSLGKAVAAALRTDNPEQALRLLRDRATASVDTAKQAIAPPAASDAGAGSSGLAPGEVPKANNTVWLIALLAAAGFLVYLVFRRSG